MENSNIKQAAQAGLARMLRPIVRVMIHVGLPLQEFVEILKAVYVDVAQTHFTEGGRPASDAKVAAQTGVHRKDVRRLRETGMAWHAPEPSALIQLGNQWGSSKTYLDALGKRKPLWLVADRPPGSSDATFEDLVQETLGTGANANELLEGLLGNQMAERLPDGRVFMDVTFLLRNPALADSIGMLAMISHDATAAVVENVLSQKRIHRTYISYSLATTPTAIAQMQAFADGEGHAIIDRLNDRLVDSQSRLRPGEQPTRITCLLSVYSENLRP